MKKVYFLTHPEVKIDRSVAITNWGLSGVGARRLRKIFNEKWLTTIDAIFSSSEKKALEAADIISKKINIPFAVVDDLGEIDRSSTGYLEPDIFKIAVNNFFGKPNESYNGWETAIQAQNRIVKAVFDEIIQTSKSDIILIVSHGGVGALLKAFLLRDEISIKHDQPSQGHYFVFTDKKELIKDWTSF